MNLVEKIKHADGRLERMKDLTDEARRRLQELIHPVLKVYAKDDQAWVKSVDVRKDNIEVHYDRYCGRGESETRRVSIPVRIFMADDPHQAAEEAIRQAEVARTTAEVTRMFLSAQHMLDSLGRVK